MFYYTMGGNGSLGFKVENLGDLFSFNYSFPFHSKIIQVFSGLPPAPCPFQTM
jgi:hypothetical protein